MTTRTTVLVASAFASLLAFAGPAAATPPATGGAGPEEEACVGRASGDACTLPNKSPGTCAPATCNRLDYSGGSPPKAIEEACVVCKQQGGPPMLGGDGGGSGETPSGEAGAEGDAAASSGGSAPENKEPPESSSRCQFDDRTPNGAGLAFLAALLLVVRTRRSRA